MVLVIRSALPDDEPCVCALWQTCGLVVAGNDPGHDFRSAVAGACSDVLVGVVESGCIRASLMVGHDGHRGWLYYVAVDPGFRQSGHGRRMIQAAEEWLRHRRVPKIHLLVRETNLEVVSFYERLGYDVVPRRVMAKRLT